MMPLSQQELKHLMQHRSPFCVSIYMPTHRLGREAQQDPIRLKNLLRQAETRLTDADMRQSEVSALLAPAADLIGDSEFWRHQGDGLAIFLSEEESHIHQLPQPVDELLVMTDHFHTRPLLPLVTTHHDFYLLALSQKNINLYRASRYDINEIPLGDMPTSLEEALAYDDPEAQLQQHRAGAGDRSIIFHGHDPSDKQKKDILRFFQKVDAGIKTHITGNSAPIILAGVDYLLPLYRQANTYPHLHPESHIIGNPQPIPADELHHKAWSMLAPEFEQQAEAQARERFMQHDGDALTSTNLDEIVRAAHHGRVDMLMIDEDARCWGVYDEEQDSLETHAAAELGSHDLLDRAAAQTFLKGGEVYVMEKDKLPVDEPAAALFRY